MHYRNILISNSRIFAAVDVGGSYSSTCRLWSMVCDKVFECTEHRSDRNSWSTMPGLWPRKAWRSTHLLQKFSWEVFNHHPPITRISCPVISIFSYTSRNSCPVSVFRMTDWDEYHSGLNAGRQTSTTQDTKIGPTVWQMSQFRRWVYWKQLNTCYICSNKSLHLIGFYFCKWLQGNLLCGRAK